MIRMEVDTSSIAITRYSHPCTRLTILRTLIVRWNSRGNWIRSNGLDSGFIRKENKPN